ncbi:putative membrane protein [Arthrobacter sp. MP_M7]|nr:putative membrane protein [Arthrobacter sp. MP_M4]MEC5203061.1 putative membrane protein [Arthrobacter sp. MP_M7]
MMAPAHDGQAPQLAAGFDDVLPLLVLAALALGYLVLSRRREREPRGWSRWRTAAFLGGVVTLALGLSPQVSPYAGGGLPGHMYQHLLIGMYAPIGLVLGAPVTLLLRSLPRRQGKRIGRFFRSAPLHVLAHPVTALVLNLGGLAALYFTPLYAAAAREPALHHLVHLHFLASGYLFAWVVAGPDPAPARPSVPARLWVLGAAIAGHAVISQLLYAGLFVKVSAPIGELRQAGELMYYAGDIAELLLAFALVSSWRPTARIRRQRPRRTSNPEPA